MKRILALLLAGLAVSAYAGDPSFSTVTFRAFNTNQFSITGGNVVLTNIGGATSTNFVPINGGVSTNQTVANPVIIAPVVSGNAYVFGNQTNTGDFQARDANLRNVTAQSITVPGPLVHYDTNGIVDLKSPTNNIPSVPIGAPLLSAGTNPTPTTKWASAALGSAAYQDSSAFDAAGTASSQNGFALVGYSSFDPAAVGSWVWDQTILTTNAVGELPGTWYHDGNITAMPWGGVLLTYGCTTNLYTGNNYPHVGYRIADTIEGLQTTTNYGVFTNAPWGQRLNSKVKSFFGTLWMVNYVGTNTAFEVAPLVGVLSYATNGNAAGVPVWHEIGVVVTNGVPGSWDQDKIYFLDINWVPGRPDPWVISYYGSWSNDTHGGVAFATATNPFVLSQWAKRNYNTNAPTINDEHSEPFMRFLPNIGWFLPNFVTPSGSLSSTSTYKFTDQWFTNPTAMTVYISSEIPTAHMGSAGGFFDDNGPAMVGSADWFAGTEISIAHPSRQRAVVAASVTTGPATVSGELLASGGGSFNGTNWGTNFYHPDGRQMFYPAGTNRIISIGAYESTFNVEYFWSNSLSSYGTPANTSTITNIASQWIMVTKASERYGKTDSSSILGNDWTNIAGTLPAPRTSPAMLAMLFHMSTNTIPADTNNPVVYLSLTNSDGNVYRIKAYQ